jgi:hypothetical protein
MENAMRVNIFQGTGGLYGFTPQANGANLPAENGPWRSFKSVEMFPDHPAHRIGVDETEVLAAIERQGYYITDARIDVSEIE